MTNNHLYEMKVGNTIRLGGSEYIADAVRDLLDKHDNLKDIDINIHPVDSLDEDTPKESLVPFDTVKRLVNNDTIVNEPNDYATIGDVINITEINSVKIDPQQRKIIDVDYNASIMRVDRPIAYIDDHGAPNKTEYVEHDSWMYNDSWTIVPPTQ